MVIVNEEELIIRFIDILSSKRNMYQKKLNEIEKRKHMKAVFTKYPESPMRCLVELADSELVQILADFLVVLIEIFPFILSANIIWCRFLARRT